MLSQIQDSAPKVRPKGLQNDAESAQKVTQSLDIYTNIYILELNMSPSGDSEANQSFEACAQGGLSGGLIRACQMDPERLVR